MVCAGFLQSHNIAIILNLSVSREVVSCTSVFDGYIPVLSVSSLNRENYMLPISMTAFKESGAIEYSSDVLFGLQFEGTDELSQKFDGRKGEKSKTDMIKQVDEWKKANPRKIQLKILKNRNGATGESVYFDYYQQFNYFREDLRL